VVVKDFAIGGLAAFVGRGVPGGEAGLGEDGLVGGYVVEVFCADAAAGNRGDGNAGGWGRGDLGLAGLWWRRQGLGWRHLGLVVMAAAADQEREGDPGKRSKPME